MGSITEDGNEIVQPVQQQWFLKPSPKKNDSFTLDDSSLSIGTSSGSGSVSDHNTATPKKQGILRVAATPGTGQSVRFGKRLYDDGDESKMSNSTANTSSFNKSQVQEPSEDAVEVSLGFIRSPRKSSSSPEKAEGSSHLDDDSEQTSLDASPSLESNDGRFGDQTSNHQSIDTFAMPNLEGYSNIEDISLDYQARDDTTAPTLSRQTKRSVDSFEDMSFNESFLQAEIELAKRCMEEETPSSHPAEQLRTDDPTSEATVLVRSQSEDEIENETTTIALATPAGANSTHGSEYLSVGSRASNHSLASTVSQWNTPRSFRGSPADVSNDEAGIESADTLETGSRSKGDESPSAQRLQRRVSVRPTLPSPSPLFARLKSLTNTPVKRSPLSRVSLPPGGFSSDVTEHSIASIITTNSDTKSHSIFSRSTCTTPSSGEAPSSPSTDSIINEIIRETDELDQVHSERSEMLLQWIEEAEEEANQMRQLLEKERERTEAALQEAEAAQHCLLKMKEDALEVEAKRSKRLQEVEELAAKLHSQLEGRSNVGEESDIAAGNASAHRDERMAELEEEVLRQRSDLERLQGALEDAKAEVYQAQQQREVEQQKHEEQLEEMRKQYEDQQHEREVAYHTLQIQLEAIENSRDGKVGDEEEEKIELHKQLIESRDEQKALQDALISAQKQIGALQGEEYKDTEALSAVKAEIGILQGHLEDVKSALQESRNREQDADKVNQENVKKLDDLVARIEEEKTQWTRKYEQMENENDSLLQSLAEAEEHRRNMEDDFLQKRDIALQESKAREEQALGLAEEMQDRLEKVEAKLFAMTTRTTMLEHEVGDRGLQLVKLEKAKERLEEDNLNYSIALSSKQQELSLLKRNTNRSLRNTPASAVSGASRLSALATRTSGVSSRGPLREIQAADESISSLAPLQSGPTNLKTMRRKTMDVHTPNARSTISSARVAGSTARIARSSYAMPPPPPSTVKQQRPLIDRQKSPEEETKINGPSSRSSSRTSHRSSDTVQEIPSRRTSSSSATQQIRPNLSSSSVASEDKSESPEAARVRKLLQQRSNDLQRAQVPVSVPFRARRSSVSVVLPA